MRHARLLLVLSFLGAAACGGGGGSAPDLFVGPYRYMGFMASSFSNRPLVHTNWGSVESFGDGQLAWHVLFVPRPPDTPSYTWPGTYALYDDHRLTLTIGGRVDEGVLAPDGRVAVFLPRDSVHAGFSIALARIGSFGNASLGGSYHWAGFAADPMGVALSSEATFDGSGGWTPGPITTCHSGVVDVVQPASGLTYAVAPHGGLAMAGPWGERDLAGGLLPGGDLAVAVGGLGADQLPMLCAFVRAGVGMSPEALWGSYWVVGLRLRRSLDNHPDRFFSFLGTMTADGAGRCYVAVRERREYSESMSEAYSAWYAVDGDGALTLDIDDGQTLVGGVSPDGTYAVLGGGMVNGDDPFFFFAVRR